MTARRSGATCRCDPASIRANSGLADYRHPAFELPPHERVGFRAGQLHRFTATRCKALRERGNGLPKLVTDAPQYPAASRPARTTQARLHLQSWHPASGHGRNVGRAAAAPRAGDGDPLDLSRCDVGQRCEFGAEHRYGQRAGPRTEPVCPCTEFPQTSRRRSSSWPRRELAERCRGPVNRC